VNSRYFGALLISPLLIFIFLGGAYLHFLAMGLSLLGMYEFYRVIKNKNINPMRLAGYILCIMYYITLYVSGNFSSALSMLIIFIMLLLCAPVIYTDFNFLDVSATILGIVYVAVFFSFIPLINIKSNGIYLVWLVFISSWSTDTVAYYVGRAFGKHKLSEKVSPKKTIEGSIGGLLGSTAVCGLYGSILTIYSPFMPIYNFFIIGLLCGVMCQFGDLVASSIKRFVGVKDYSNLIPGHGGILDRFDSILFASVVVYYYVTFIVGI
jgi:phosphatidate cytidylyltransferase